MTEPYAPAEPPSDGEWAPPGQPRYAASASVPPAAPSGQPGATYGSAPTPGGSTYGAPPTAPFSGQTYGAAPAFGQPPAAFGQPPAAFGQPPAASLGQPVAPPAAGSPSVGSATVGSAGAPGSAGGPPAAGQARASVPGSTMVRRRPTVLRPTLVPPTARQHRAMHHTARPPSVRGGPCSADLRPGAHRLRCSAAAASGLLRPASPLWRAGRLFRRWR